MKDMELDMVMEILLSEHEKRNMYQELRRLVLEMFPLLQKKVIKMLEKVDQKFFQ